MKITITGILSKAALPEGNSPKQFQRVEISMPRFDRFTGEKIGVDIYPGVIFEKVIPTAMAINYEGQKVKVTGFLNSNVRENDGKTYRDLYFSVQEIESYK